MKIQFHDLVEEVRKLSLEEKEELKDLLNKYLIEEKRKSIHQSYLESVEELKNKKADFSSDINQLKEKLNLD